jgi:hypothetical protein
MNRRRLRFSYMLFATGLVLLTLGVYALGHPQRAAAVSSYLTQARAQYPAIKGTTLDSCQLCHPSGGYTLNSYAQDFANNGHSFTAIANLDSDGDGYTNIQEITALTFPGDAASHPGAAATATRTATATSTQPAPPATQTPTPTSAGPTATRTATPAGATATQAAPTATPTSAAGPTATPRPLSHRAALLGAISDIPEGASHTGDWRVQGHTIHVSSSTYIEQSQLLGEDPEHLTVWVLGTRGSNGSINAIYIRVLSVRSAGGDNLVGR